VSQIDPIYDEIAGRVGRGDNELVPILLQKIVNLEQARIMRELPNTVEVITNNLAIDSKTVEENLQYLFERGVVTPGKRGWNMVTSEVLLKDFIATAPDKYYDKEIINLARDMSLVDPRKMAERIQRGEEKLPLRQTFRVIPKWRTIKDIPGVLPIEDIREIFRNNPPITIGRCPCRSIHRERGCQSGVPFESGCATTGRRSRRNAQRGIERRELTYDELIAYFDEIDQHPVVSMTGNSNRMPTAVCSCCSDCCGVLIRNSYVKPVLGQYTFAKSRFEVEDRPEECTACGICTDNRCPVNAISMKNYPGLDGERAYTDPEACIGCGLCVLTCPTDARKMKLVRPPEHIPDFETMFDDIP
jgi:NAD-dependent dihydropyrimidine dehydrogenase PreA subunit